MHIVIKLLLLYNNYKHILVFIFHKHYSTLDIARAEGGFID